MWEVQIVIMIKKQDVLQLIDDQLERINDSYTMDDAAEVSLLMLRNKVENLPDAGEDDLK